jgi:WD40 repeat protein
VIVAPGGERFVAPDIQQLDLRQDRQGGLAQLARELTQLALDAQGGFGWDSHRPPYPGLLAFQAEDAAIYFGRDDDVRRLIERLNARRVQGAPNLVALLGSSGSGKSSLLRAGVLPRLKRDRRNWIVLPPFRPRLDPVGEFARSASEAMGKPEEWRAWGDRFASEESGKALAELTEVLQTGAGSREAHVLISIDQAEELFTVTPPEAAAGFLRLMKAAADDRSMFVGLVTLRSDYLGQLQAAAEDVVRFEEFSLGPMPLNRIRQIIEGPARVAGLKVEEGLIAAATADAGTEDALPLLAFTLRELYDRYVDDRGNDNATRQLSLVHYAALGDPAAGLNPLENSVRKRADEDLAEASPSEEDLAALREAFVGGLVWINGEGEYSRRPAIFDELPEKARPILQRLESARLVIVGEDAGKRTVEVAHESLLRKWPRLRGWLDQERDFLIGRSQLDHALADFEQASEADKPAALLHGLFLSRARQWLVDHPRALTDREKAFVAASEAAAAAERRRSLKLRRMLIAGAVAVVAVVIVAGGLIFVAEQNRQLAESEAEAAARQSDATLLAFASSDLLEAGDVRGAAAKAVEAVETVSTAETRSSLLQSVMALSPHLVRSKADGSMRPGLLAFPPASDRLLIGGSNGRVHSWNPVQGGKASDFAAIVQEESSGPQPPALRALAATKLGGAAIVLDDGRLLRLDATGKLAGETSLAADIGKAAVAPDGERLLAASHSTRAVNAYACDDRQGQLACEPTLLASDFATALALDGSGKTAALALQGEGLVRVDLSGPTPATTPIPLSGNPKLQSLAFDADGALLAAGSVDGRIFLIGAGGGVSELPRQSGSIAALAWDPASHRLATACGGVDICVWALSAGNDAVLERRLAGHTNTILAIAWAPAGGALASASVDGSVKYWQVDAFDPVALALETPRGGALTDLDLSFDGKWLAAGSGEGTVFVFDLPALAFDRAIPNSREAEIRSLRWHPSRPWFADVDADGFLAVRSWPDGEAVEEFRLDEALVETIRWLPDGNSIVAATLGGEVRLWPLGGEPVDFNAVHLEPVLGLAVLPAGDRLLSSDAAGNLWLWDIATRERIVTAWPKADAAVDTVAVSHSGRKVLVTGNGGILYIYDLETPGEPVRIDLGSRQIDGAVWSPDDSLIAAVDTDGNLKVWSFADGGLLAWVKVYPTGGRSADDRDPAGHLRRMLWLPDRQAVAIATSAGAVVIVTHDPAAWLARARSVFGLPPAAEPTPPMQ